MAIKIQLINCAQDPTIQKPEESAAFRHHHNKSANLNNIM